MLIISNSYKQFYYGLIVEDGKKIVAKKTMRRERDTSDKMKETIKKAKGIWEKLRRWVWLIIN